MAPTPLLFRAPAKRGLLICSLVAWLISAPAAAAADVVADWNIIALTRITAGHPGPAGVIDLAVVQAAVYDAMQAYDRKYHPYALTIPNATGSPIAAVARAARDTLVARLPASQTALVDIAYMDYFVNNGLALNDPGVAVGALAAAGVLALRMNDGSFPAPGTFPEFNGASVPGVWRPTPTAFATMASPWAGAVLPFTIGSTAGFQPEPPPALSSAQYTEAYNEVKAYGSLASAVRTLPQTQLARFYNDNFLAQWNRALRDVAAAHGLDSPTTARLLALANMATADAFICAWESKKFFAFWRPITAIHEGNTDGNDATAGDSNWTPFLTTPPYPDYTSGANNVTAAMTRTLALFFGTDHVTFTVTSLSTSLQPGDPTSITYTRFSDAAKDVIDVRILQGIHFRFADTEARSQGRRVANHAFKNVLLPLDQKGRK